MYGLSENVRGGKQTKKKNESINQLRNYHNNSWRQKSGNIGDYCTENYVFGQL